MSGEGQPDQTDNSGGRDTASSGYPEEQPGGAQPEGEGSEKGGGDHAGSPEQSPDRDSDAGDATGNPGAAG